MKISEHELAETLIQALREIRVALSLPVGDYDIDAAYALADDAIEYHKRATTGESIFDEEPANAG